MNLLTDLFQILTPEGIAELLTKSSDSEKIGLTGVLEEILEVELDLGKNKTALEKELSWKEKEKKEKKGIYASDSIVEYIKHFIEKFEIDQDALKEKEEGVTSETSTFILKEKKRFEYVYAKLKSKEVEQLYLENINVDIEQEKTLKDDLSKSPQSGSLVDKKHY